jgi:molecular chaperone GrpE
LNWVDGLRLIYRKLQATLETQGLTEIKSVGETFDPAVHEAVTQAEGEEGKVIEELQKGYKLHDRVIRPALVVVGRGSGGGEEEPGETDD